MKSADFELYEKLLYKESGLVITSEKSYLLDSRLSPVAKKWDCTNMEGLTEALRKPVPNRAIIKDIVEAMTTNETSFFRDMNPFKNFENIVLPFLIKTKAPGSTIRIWCSACSSGQEPYSIAMMLKENEAKLNSLKIDIIATDLSDQILDTARKAKYTQFEVQRGMPIQLLVKYFKQDGESWLLNDEIKNMVKFQPINLLKPFPIPGTFDVIFCRNVLIYFDKETKTEILNRLYDKMEKHAFLLLGGAETVLGLTDKIKPLVGQRGLYIGHDSTYTAE